MAATPTRSARNSPEVLKLCKRLWRSNSTESQFHACCGEGVRVHHNLFTDFFCLGAGAFFISGRPPEGSQFSFSQTRRQIRHRHICSGALICTHNRGDRRICTVQPLDYPSQFQNTSGRWTAIRVLAHATNCRVVTRRRGYR